MSLESNIADGFIEVSTAVKDVRTKVDASERVVTFPTGSEPSLVGVPDGTLWIEYAP